MPEVIHKNSDASCSTSALTILPLRVLSVECDLYMHNNNADLKIPYLNSTETMSYDSTMPFVIGIRSIFATSQTSAGRLMKALKEGTLKAPTWKIATNLSESQGGYYHSEEKTIYLNEDWILAAERDLADCWLLFRVMIEETGHYIDDVLWGYANMSGDSPGDEGTLFAADFIRYNKLFSKTFEFAKFEIETLAGGTKEFKAKVLKDNPPREEKIRDILYMEADEDDFGLVTLPSGQKVVAEFFRIRYGGAVHEHITKEAVKNVRLIYGNNIGDLALIFGVEWPDVPCGKAIEDDVMVCFTSLGATFLEVKGTMAYESHYGSKQYWHSMAPPGNYTNQQVLNLSLIHI